ncbi:MAG: amidohydrolase family protein [Planctomycetota bacterium]
MARSFVRPLSLVLALGAAAFAQEQATAFKNARILPGGAVPIEHGVLVVGGGKVLAIGGADTVIPDGAAIVDCAGKTITPGLIDAAFRVASVADANENSDEVTPHLRVLDSLDPDDKSFARARAAGVTTVHVMPGTRSVIGGLGCVVKTFGSDPRAMVVKEDASLRIVMGSDPSQGNRAIRGGQVDSIYYRRPTTRMGVVWAVRRAFFDAKEALQQTAAQPPTPGDPGTEILTRVLKGQLTAITTARSEQDLRTALRLAEEFGYKTILDEAQDAHVVLDELVAAKSTVLLGSPSATSVSGPGGGDGADPRSVTVRELAERGVPFVITTGSNAQALELVREAMFAVRNGLGPTRALDAITIEPARLLGLDQRLGSLAPGKDADFVVWSTDPLDPAAIAESVHIDGISVLAPR